LYLLFPVAGWIAGFFINSYSYGLTRLYCFFDKDGNIVSKETIKHSGLYPPKTPKLQDIKTADRE
jgi:hypothetical protein